MLDRTTVSSPVHALDEIEPGLQHLSDLIIVLRILGETDEPIELIAISSLAGCAGDTLDRIEENWRTAGPASSAPAARPSVIPV